MSATRNQIFSALYALGRAATWTVNGAPQTFQSGGRRFRAPDDVPPEAQPALFQLEHEEAITQVTRMPSKRFLTAAWVVYQCAAKDPNSEPTELNNDILDALETALKPLGACTAQTLGGLVQHCWIEGEIFKDPGDIDEWGIVIVPVKILIP